MCLILKIFINFAVIPQVLIKTMRSLLIRHYIKCKADKKGIIKKKKVKK